MLHLCGSWSYPFLWGCDWWHLQKTSVFGAAALPICLWGLRSSDMLMVSFCCFEVLVLLVCCLEEEWIEFASSNWHRTFSRISNVHHWFNCSVSFFSCPLAVSRFWGIVLRVEEFFMFSHMQRYWHVWLLYHIQFFNEQIICSLVLGIKYCTSCSRFSFHWMLCGSWFLSQHPCIYVEGCIRFLVLCFSSFSSRKCWELRLLW
jgi:hypothetical protein